LELQMRQCLRYNSPEPWRDLLKDCDAGVEEHIAQDSLFVLAHHTDEVWHIQFSHDGTRIASASKDTTVVIWDVTTRDVTRDGMGGVTSRDAPVVIHVLSGHLDAVSSVAWSQEDRWLLSCGNDRSIRLWDPKGGNLLQTFFQHTEPVTALAWLPGGTRFVSGGFDKRICTWSVLSPEPEAVLQGERITDLAVTADGSRMFTISPDKKITVFSMPCMEEVASVVESESMTSLCVSEDGRHILVCVSSEARPEVHLWDMDESLIVQRYRGHKSGRYVLRSAFGGAREAFVVCGSECSQVYLWHRESGALLARLAGHSATINCVSWNRADRASFASASDDNTIRIWRLPSPSAAGLAPVPYDV